MFDLRVETVRGSKGPMLHLGRMRTRLAFAVGAAVLASSPLVAPPASAQTASSSNVCEAGGYWYIQKAGKGNALAIACPGGASFEEAAPAPSAARNAPALIPEDCEPGGYWYMQNEEAMGAGGTAVAMKCR